MCRVKFRVVTAAGADSDQPCSPGVLRLYTTDYKAAVRAVMRAIGDAAR
jgi:hypothetical protein